MVASAVVLLSVSWLAVNGQTRTLLVQVEDAQRRPVRGIEIGIEGAGGSALTGDDGKALVPLARDAAENDWVSLQILHSPPGEDLVMVSPWDYRAQVPSLRNKFVLVVVVRRGDRTALENNGVVTAFAAKLVNKAASSSKLHSPEEESPDPRVNLDILARQYGLKSDEVDEAIRGLGPKTTDPYEAGLAALYQEKYPLASAHLRDSLRQRESKLAADERAVADAAFFLGMALSKQGKYREAAVAYEKCLSLRSDDPMVLNNTALSLASAGDYVSSEPLYRRALAIRERALGPDHPDVANSLNNLGSLMQFKGEYVEAEQLYRRALAIREKALGPNHPDVATSLNNLAFLLKIKGQYGEAERLYRRALLIKENELGPNHPRLFPTLNNLALLLKMEGHYAVAESLYERALTIEERAFGPDHPNVGIVLSNLAGLRKAQGDYPRAERLYARALEIEEKDLGPDHPSTRLIRQDLDCLHQDLEHRN